MLKITNKTVTTEDDCKHTRYDVEGYAECDGSGIWGYDGDMRVEVSAIDIFGT